MGSAKWDRGARRRHRCLKHELELGNHHLPPPHPCPQQRCSAAWSLPRTAWQSHAVGLRPVHRLPWGADEHSNGMRSPWGLGVSALGFTVRIARICMNANDSPMHVCCPAPNPMNEYLRACARACGRVDARVRADICKRFCACARVCAHVSAGNHAPLKRAICVLAAEPSFRPPLARRCEHLSPPSGSTLVSAPQRAGREQSTGTLRGPSLRLPALLGVRARL